VDFLDWDTGNLSPRLVCIGVVIENWKTSQLSFTSFTDRQVLTFVSKHEGNGHQPKLTTFLSPHRRIELLQSVDEHESQ
jgi:hypothetical protein